MKKSRGARLRELREDAGLSQGAVAKAISRDGFSITQRGISKIEKDQVLDTRADTLRRLVVFYDTTEEWVNTGEGEKHPVRPRTGEESELVMLFRALSASGQGYILGRARDLYRDEYGKPPPSAPLERPKPKAQH